MQINQKILELQILSKTKFRSSLEVQSDMMEEISHFVGTPEQLSKKQKDITEKSYFMYHKEKNKHFDTISVLWEKIKKEVSTEEGVQFFSHKNQMAWKIAYDEKYKQDYSDIVDLYRSICVLIK